VADFSLSSSLSAAAVALVAGALGLRGSVWLQEREHARRQRNSAIALREDLRRITDLLGPEGVGCVTSLEPGGEPEVPIVHPWVEPLITDMASADPEIVRRFMILQRDLLVRGRHLATYLEAARSEAHWLLQRDNYTRFAAARDGNERVYAAERDRAIAEIPKHEAARAAQEGPFVTADGRLRRNLTRLGGLLDTIIAKQPPSLVPDGSEEGEPARDVRR
jgi:hypothetical protein